MNRMEWNQRGMSSGRPANGLGMGGGGDQNNPWANNLSTVRNGQQHFSMIPNFQLPRVSSPIGGSWDYNQALQQLAMGGGFRGLTNLPAPTASRPGEAAFANGPGLMDRYRQQIAGQGQMYNRPSGLLG